MGKIALAIHGGAGPDSEFIHKHKKEYEKGLEEALNAGYKMLEEGSSAVDAVEEAIKSLEDNPLFNAGKGSALNEKAEVEMCSSIMNGYDLTSGAAAIIRNVRNPISMARAIMEKTTHIYLGDSGASELAKRMNLPMEPDAYFITQHQYEEYEKKRQKENVNGQEIAFEHMKKHGTVGAVALDMKGNIAAGTSTGGTEFSAAGRIGDSSMIGAGTYADNNTCAVSTTGEGEINIQHVTAFHISALMEYGGMSLKKACQFMVHEKCKKANRDLGLIALDKNGNIAIEFNTQRMHRGWKTARDKFVMIYPAE
jgi:L-asparaginase / beta-aspartyl-peptidase